jgi:hypothetical protein
VTATATAPDGAKLAIDIAEWPFRFEVIDLRATFIDARYQRDLKPIKSVFDPRLVGCLTVNERPRAGVNLSVIDGQRRRDKILAVKFDSPVPACVFEDLTLEQEAELFSLFQRERKSITPFERFKSDLVAKVPVSMAINKMISEEGFEMAANDSTMRELKAVRGIERIYAEDPELLRTVLQLVRMTWDGVPFASRDQMLKGIAWFVQSTEDLDMERFVKRLKDVTPSELNRRADMHREAKGLTGSSPRFMGEVIQDAYRRKGR